VNEAPKARAGGNRIINLPSASVYFNGSSSSDDVRVVSWRWERQPESLAAGTVLANSDNTSVLEV